VDNPFLAVRRNLGIPQAEFARTLGVSLPTLWAAEKGSTARPMSVLRALRTMGYDAQRLGEEYVCWRAEQRESQRLRLREDATIRSAVDGGFRRLESFSDGDGRRGA
jgi:DNA-binding XRE family transcriptional regulator